MTRSKTVRPGVHSFDRLSVIAIAESVEGRRRSAVDVVRDAIARADAYEAVQPAVWISRVAKNALLAQAHDVDERNAAEEHLPLAGVPFAIKDNIDLAGEATTAACPDFAYTPETSATVVQRLVAAGAVPIGKTNLDQFATGLSGTRSPYGALGAVYNRDFISGGSSSGSAVAVAAGLVAFALGTDTAGSGRVPAAFNHLVGLKPTKGRWSTSGVVPACRSLDCVTVLSSTVADAARVDEIAAGFDDGDPFSRHAPERGSTRVPDKFRVGVPDRLERLSDNQSERLFDAALQRVVAMGGMPVEIDMSPLSAAARLLYQGPWVAERTAAIETLLAANPAAIHPVVREIVEGGCRYSALDAFKAEYELRALQRDAERLWKAVDVLLLPTAPTTYRITEMLADPVALNANLGLYTNFVNLLDMSAIAVPAGFRDNRTGFGVTFIAPAWDDRKLLDVAQRYEDHAPMPVPPPLDLGEHP